MFFYELRNGFLMYCGTTEPLERRVQLLKHSSRRYLIFKLSSVVARALYYRYFGNYEYGLLPQSLINQHFIGSYIDISPPYGSDSRTAVISTGDISN